MIPSNNLYPPTFQKELSSSNFQFVFFLATMLFLVVTQNSCITPWVTNIKIPLLHFITIKPKQTIEIFSHSAFFQVIPFNIKPK